MTTSAGTRSTSTPEMIREYSEMFVAPAHEQLHLCRVASAGRDQLEGAVVDPPRADDEQATVLSYL